MDKKFTESKKAKGLLVGLIAGVVISAAAVAAGPAAVAVLPDVLTFIGSLCGAHQLSQGVQDVFTAKAANKTADTSQQAAGSKDTVIAEIK